MITLVATTCAGLLPHFLFGSQLEAWGVSISGVCVLLWITEAVPPFVPSILLWVFIPLILAPYDPRFGLRDVLNWAADPVLGLFFGGFALGAAAHATGLDAKLEALIIRIAGGSLHRLILVVMVVRRFSQCGSPTLPQPR